MFSNDNKYRVKEIEAEEGAEFILASLKVITWEEYEEHSEQRQKEIAAARGFELVEHSMVLYVKKISS